MLVASFARHIFFNLAACVSDWDEIIYIFFPFQTSQAGLEPVIVLSVEYLLLEAFTRSQLTLAS